MKNLTVNSAFGQLLTTQSVAGSGSAAATSRFDVAGAETVTILLALGEVDAATTITFKLTQSDAASSGNTKDIDEAALTSVVTAGKNSLYAITVNANQLDATNGYRYVGASYTITNAKNVLMSVVAISSRLRSAPPASSGLAQNVLVTH